MLGELYIERVYQRIALGASQDEANLYRKAIEYALPKVLEEFALRIAKDKSTRSLLQKLYTIALAGGVAPLGVGGTSDLLSGYIAWMRHPDNPNLMQPLPDYQALIAPKSHDFFYYYTITGNSVYAMKSDGVSLPADKNLTAMASFIPVLTLNTSTVPGTREGMVVDVGTEITLRKIAQEGLEVAATPPQTS